MGLRLHPLTGSNTYRLCFNSTQVERARWPVTPPPAICAEKRCPVSSRLYGKYRKAQTATNN